MEAFERYPGEEEKGLREGYHARAIAQGRAEERARLLRLAERRFDPETVAQLSELLVDADGAEKDPAQAGD